jgi:hypothetical protein
MPDDVQLIAMLPQYCSSIVQLATITNVAPFAVLHAEKSHRYFSQVTGSARQRILIMMNVLFMLTDSFTTKQFSTAMDHTEDFCSRENGGGL